MAQSEVAQLTGCAVGQVAALTGLLDEASGAGLAFSAREFTALRRQFVTAVTEVAGLTATGDVAGGRAVAQHTLESCRKQAVSSMAPRCIAQHGVEGTSSPCVSHS